MSDWADRVRTARDHRHVGTPRACELAGVTFRQSDHWVRIGLLEPAVRGKGSGRYHQWTRDDVALLHVLGTLARLGERMHPTVAATVARELSRLPLDWWPEVMTVAPDGALVPDDNDETVTVTLRPKVCARYVAEGWAS